MPGGAEVEVFIGLAFGLDTERGIADEEGGIGIGEHGGQVGAHGHQVRLDAETFAEQDAREHDRGAGAMIDGEAADPRPGRFGEQENAADRSIAGDTGSGNGRQVLAGSLDDGDEADVGLAVPQAVGALRRQAKGEVRRVFLGPLQHAPDQGNGVEVADGGDAGFGQKHESTDLDDSELAWGCTA